MNPEFNDYGNELQAFDGSSTPACSQRRTLRDILWRERGDGWKATWNILGFLLGFSAAAFCVISAMTQWP